MVDGSLKSMIDLAESRIDEIPENARRFVEKMIWQRDHFGDKQFVTMRQRNYLVRLCSELAKPVESEKPKSNLEKLREKKSKMLRAQAKRRRRYSREEYREAQVMAKITDGELMIQKPEAQIVHQRSSTLENSKRLKNASRAHIGRKS